MWDFAMKGRRGRKSSTDGVEGPGKFFMTVAHVKIFILE